MADKACRAESSRLLVNTASDEDSSLQPQLQRAAISCPPPKYLCLPSKAAILILLWTAIVGVTYHNLVGFFAVAVLGIQRPNTTLSVYEPLPYAILALVMMFYPLSGFIADVCCGRLKAVIISLICILSFSIGILVALSLLVSISKPDTPIHHMVERNLGIACVIVILAIISLLAFIIGLAGYQANFIQLGLDQLFEAPSQYLVLFIHYATWTFNFGSLHFIINVYVIKCVGHEKMFAVVIIQVLIPLLLIVLLVISCWKRQWFLSEPGYQNPYKVVCGVFKFAKSHKHPLRRSAFTHSDDYVPSRLDFAKERFGGPFTTEQVENVKTFIRILLVLLAVGPAFALEVPGTYFVAPLFGIHFHHYVGSAKYCKDKIPMEDFLEIASVFVLPSFILFPVCSLLIFSLLRKKLVRLFARLGVGILFCLLGVLCFLFTDIVGHAQQNVSNSNNHTQCVFHVSLSHHKRFIVDSFHMHWAVLIPPYVFLGIGTLMVTATTLEFISAQSPQSMKGLLIGVFFAIRGLFQFLNSIVIIPLSLKQPWASREMIEHPPVTNCGFVYLALTSVTGLIGLILFSLAAKRYKYRTRDEGMFRQHDVEEIYDRYIDQRGSEDYSFDSVDD